MSDSFADASGVLLKSFLQAAWAIGGAVLWLLWRLAQLLWVLVTLGLNALDNYFTRPRAGK